MEVDKTNSFTANGAGLRVLNPEILGKISVQLKIQNHEPEEK